LGVVQKKNTNAKLAVPTMLCVCVRVYRFPFFFRCGHVTTVTTITAVTGVSIVTTIAAVTTVTTVLTVSTVTAVTAITTVSLK
jgi:hypothetical protein